MAIEQNPFGVESIDEAQELIARPDSEAVQASLDFYYGDHWQDGKAWAGPIPAQTEADYQTIADEIEAGFCSKNTVREITDRAADAVTGRQPIWDVIPNRVITATTPITADEELLMAEAKVLLTNWMEDKDFEMYLSKALRHTLLSGAATLRLCIPSGYVQGGTVIVDDQDPLNVLFIDAPNPLVAGVVTDPNSKESEAVVLGKIGETETAEISYLLPVATDTGRVTEITLLIGVNKDQDIQSVQLELGGALPVYQMQMPRLITEQIVSMQKALNLNLTMMTRNSVLGGFLERVILNGQLPGHYDEDGEFIRDDFTVGAGTVNSIAGLPITNPADGSIAGYQSASIAYKDPVSPLTFLQAENSLYEDILQSSSQLHALINGDAAASGESRRQAVATFFAYLRTPKKEVDKAGRWALKTVLAYAGFLTGDPNRYSSLRVIFDAKIDVGAIPADEIALMTNMVATGIVSLETAREKLGVEDPAEEARRVEAEAGQLAQIGVQDNKGFSKTTGIPLQNVDNNDITN